MWDVLVLNVDNTDRLFSKTNPPIRSREDNERLWQGINDGVINVVATDCAPAFKAKKANLWESPLAIGGNEIFLPAMLSEGVNKGKITLEKLVEVGFRRLRSKIGKSVFYDIRERL